MNKQKRTEEDANKRREYPMTGADNKNVGKPAASAPKHEQLLPITTELIALSVSFYHLKTKDKG